MNISSLVTRVDEILATGRSTVGTSYNEGVHYSEQMVAQASMAAFCTSALSFIERVYGKDHTHYQQFKSKTGRPTEACARNGVAIMEAIRGEIAGGWLFSVKGLVAAELFADFISMAEHLLEAGYKDPAAVMAGSVLEEHLRQLSGKHGVALEDERDGKLVPRKADRLNAELCKADAYSMIDQKQITAWLDLRNNAAHGKYDAYTKDQVDQMIRGILSFLARVTL